MHLTHPTQIGMVKRFEEGIGVILSFLYYFFVLSSYYVMRPMRDQLAAEAGSANLPWFFIATLAATVIATPLFSLAASRWPRRIVIPCVYLAVIAIEMGFIPFFLNHELVSPKVLGMTFFVWVSVFNLIVVSVFWTFMSDIWSSLQARRLFPLIALGGTLGAVIGPLITRNFVETLGSASLLGISMGLLAGALFCILLLGKWARSFGIHRKEAGSDAPLGGGMLDGLKQVIKDPFIRTMAILMLLNDMIGTIAYSLIIDYSGTVYHNNPTLQTEFAADLDLSANLLQIIVQLTVTPFILVRFGPGPVFLTAAGIIVFFCLSMAILNDPYQIVYGSIPMVGVILILTRSLSYSMVQPARESLYTMVSRDLRYKGKNAVDTVVWRAGDVLSLFAVQSLRSLGISTAGFGLIFASLASASGLIAYRLATWVKRRSF